MPTHSVILAVEDAIVTQLDAALTVPVTYAWPGKSTESVAVFLGQHPEVQDILLDVSGEDPVMKAGRRQRQETFDVVITIWAFRPDITVANARLAAGSAHAVFNDIDDVFRNDFDLGVAGVHSTTITAYPRRLFPFQAGWAAEIRVTVQVQARLT